MLRSMFSSISGLRAHQTMMDVTGNNISNVNTAGYKSGQTVFQDTLSQLVQAAGAPSAGLGGTNPAQVGLGTRVASISNNFGQGAAQSTGKSTDLMISGDGFFITEKGAETLYTRAGSFTFDSDGKLVTPDGSFVQGWQGVNGAVDTNGPLSNLTLPIGVLYPPVATTSLTIAGNLPADDPGTTPIVTSIPTFDAQGNEISVSATFSKVSATSWNVTLTDGTTTAGPTAMTFAANGTTPSPTTLTLGGITVDLSGVTDFAKTTTVAALTQNGSAVGSLQAYNLGPDGSLVGVFSNGLRQTLGRVALATFTNPQGLEKAGGSGYRSTVNSGTSLVGTAGSGGRGTLQGGALEMSNVDLAQEFTNLIIAQRGFQANSRVITASDEILQDLVNMKR